MYIPPGQVPRLAPNSYRAGKLDLDVCLKNNCRAEIGSGSELGKEIKSVIDQVHFVVFANTFAHKFSAGETGVRRAGVAHGL